MLIPVLLFALGLVLLIKGGDWFVDAASGIAHRFHMPELLIGATVVSIGTTLPQDIDTAQPAHPHTADSPLCRVLHRRGVLLLQCLRVRRVLPRVRHRAAGDVRDLHDRHGHADEEEPGALSGAG